MIRRQLEVHAPARLFPPLRRQGMPLDMSLKRVIAKPEFGPFVLLVSMVVVRSGAAVWCRACSSR